MDDFGGVLADLPSENDHSELGKDVEDGHHDDDQVVERAEQVFHCFKDDSHGFDLVEKGQKFDHANEDNDLEDFDCVVIFDKVAIGQEVLDHGGNVKHLAKGLGPDSEVVLVRPDRTTLHIDITQCLE